MARRKKHAEHENHERWLISYADFITLLFAFFVVMFASSQADKGRAEQVSESVKKALEADSVSAVIAAVLGGAVDTKGQGNAMMKGPGGAKVAEERKTEEQAVELTPSLKSLSEDLKEEIAAGRIEISMQARGLVVSFTQAALFPSGTDEISSTALKSLEKVAAAVAKVSNPVRLEGHTDSNPIHTTRFRSNWELSTARAIALLEMMGERFRVPKSRMSVAGYADTAPVATNGTEEGRARNRRVDVIVLNEQASIAEPPKPKQAAAEKHP